MAGVQGKVNYHGFMSLPCRQFPAGSKAECAICHEGFSSSYKAKLLPCATFTACPSFFHGDCLLQWLERQCSCPLCRRSFEGELGRAPSPHSHAVSSSSRPTENSFSIHRGNGSSPASAFRENGNGIGFRRGGADGSQSQTLAGSARDASTSAGPADDWFAAHRELLQVRAGRRRQPVAVGVEPSPSGRIRRTLSSTSSVQARARGPQFLTDASSLDVDTRDTVHRMQAVNELADDIQRCFSELADLYRRQVHT